MTSQPHELTKESTMTETTHEVARLTADVCLFGRREGNLYVAAILRARAPYEGYWALPGGRVEVDEETVAAAHRELAEETGASVDALELVGVYSTPRRDPRGRYVSFAYACLLPHTIPLTGGDEGATFPQWFLVDELLSAPGRLAFDHRRILRDALRIVTGGRP
jgi:8-oxo-dGTP diphosphatase